MARHPKQRGASRARLFWFLLWSACLLTSLRGHAPFDPRPEGAGAGWWSAPLRLAAELASPLAVLRTRTAHAAEDRLVDALEREVAEVEVVLAGLARSAEPAAPELRQGRRIVACEVLGREPRNRDRLRVRAADGRALRRGLPVACGDAYVGRVVEVRRRRGEVSALAVVELVTAPGFHVGGRVGELEGTSASGPVYLTVGGLAADPSGDVRLAVHHPSDRGVTGGLVWVFERFGDIEPFAGLAEGLLLGRLVGEPRTGTWWVRPELDYLDGLFQVVVLAPPDKGPEGFEGAPDEVFAGERWVPTRALGCGDPSPWRSATKIGAGTRHGIVAGAAVTGLGARLLGRVSRAGALASDVSFLDDPGFRLVAVARLAGEDEPRVLGRLISEGRAADGAVRMRWIVRVGLADVAAGRPGEREVEARLFTGSGDPGVPAGLFFGAARLPLDARPGEVRDLRVRADVAGREVRSLFARAEPPPFALEEAP